MTSESIPGDIEKLTWTLATTVCEKAKIDTEQWFNLLPEFKNLFVQRWRADCQKVTDLERQEWKDQIRREYLELAFEKCEPAWRRFLYYDRCKHLRYIAILASAAAVSYLCPQETIYLLLRRARELWGYWYFASTFVVLICVPSALVLTIAARKFSQQRSFQRITAGVLTLGFAVPVILLFATLCWQMVGGVHEWSSWIAWFVAIPVCAFGFVVAIAEIFDWPAKRPSHPLEVYISEQSDKNTTRGLRDQIEQKLTQFALEVCRSAPMDDDAFQHDTAGDIHNFLYLQWEDHLNEKADSETALADTLLAFGTAKSAAYTDDPRVRILFYHRHRTTRYLSIIGFGLLVLYALLIATTGTDLNGRWLWSIKDNGMSILTIHSKGGDWIWALWGQNVLYGSLLALCIFLKSRLANVVWPLNHLFGLGALWWLWKICLDAVFVLGTILGRWHGWELVLPLVIFSLTVCPAFIYLIACAVGEYFTPFSEKSVAKVRRWIKSPG